MRVLLDENVDRRLRRFFDSAFDVATVTEQGWSGKKNGDLLGAAAQS
jgi:predicted nuclease of predicted toxin-antitoxin system